MIGKECRNGIHKMGKKTKDEEEGTLSWGWKTASHLPARKITWINWQSPAQDFLTHSYRIEPHRNMSQGHISPSQYGLTHLTRLTEVTAHLYL